MKTLELRKILPITVVMCFAIFAALPLFRSGFLPTHDGEYHLIRFHEFETMLINGYFFPRWAPNLNSGYGVPIFNFHYPLPNYLGVAFHSLGFSLADSFKLVLAAGYLSGVLFTFIWLSKKFSKNIAAAATIVFAFVPYWFVELYVRGEVGEVLAIAWLMLIFAAIERDWPFLISLAYAALILSHNILALIFTPIIVVYILLTKAKYWWIILIGLGLAAYFWVPALMEQKYVVGLNTVNYGDYFPAIYQLIVPSWGTGLSGIHDLGNEMSYQIGLIPLLVIILAIFLGLKDKSKTKWYQRLFMISTVTAISLMFNYSLPVWKTLPFLQFVQYPWRFLVIVIPATGFFAAYDFWRFNKLWLTWGVAILAVVAAYTYARPAIYLPRSDAYYLTKSNFTDGTSSLGNSFSTIWTSWKQTRPKSRVELISGGGTVTNFFEKPLKYEFDFYASKQSTIRVNTLYYPGWQVVIDGKSQPVNYKDQGTINFPIPGGRHVVKVYFTETPSRLLANSVTILSLFWFISWAILKKYGDSH